MAYGKFQKVRATKCVVFRASSVGVGVGSLTKTRFLGCYRVMKWLSLVLRENEYMVMEKGNDRRKDREYG